jgi:hypothetical protein
LLGLIVQLLVGKRGPASGDDGERAAWRDLASLAADPASGIAVRGKKPF